MFDLVVRSRRAVTPEGERPAAVAVAGGRIAAIEGYDTPLRAAAQTDLGEVALLPGLVDTHVHVNDPGRAEWEGFATIAISNLTAAPVRLYPREGIAQLIFLQSDEVCATSYKDKDGKYQAQKGITTARV